MESRHLRAFLAVVRVGSFTGAAAELKYSQSTITEQVQALEAELGATLFDRSGRRPRPTPAGERFVEYAERFLALAGQARAAVRADAEPDGTLTLGGLETLCVHLVPLLLGRYRERCPNVRVVVRLGTRGELLAGVRRAELDACLTFGEPTAEPGLATVELGRVRLMVVGAPGHRLRHLDQVARADLVGEEFLATEPGCGFRAMFDAALGGGAPGPVLVAEVASMAALRGCAATGAGLALLPEIAVTEQVARGEVTAAPLAGAAGADTDVAITLTWARGAELTPGLAPFVELASTRAELLVSE